tara:strand:+ start:1247 stop:1420 length:174 start_codon:yes stop_codon:yes gene_type:complete
MREEPHIVHSDIEDPNYESRDQEFEAKTQGVKLDLILRLGFLGAVVIVLVVASWLGG